MSSATPSLLWNNKLQQTDRNLGLGSYGRTKLCPARALRADAPPLLQSLNMILTLQYDPNPLTDPNTLI